MVWRDKRAERDVVYQANLGFLPLLKVSKLAVWAVALIKIYTIREEIMRVLRSLLETERISVDPITRVHFPPSSLDLPLKASCQTHSSTPTTHLHPWHLPENHPLLFPQPSLASISF